MVAKASTRALGQGRIGSVTAPEPHNPPLTRRAARMQRERDAGRAFEASSADPEPGTPAEARGTARREAVSHTVPLPIIDLPAAVAPAPLAATLAAELPRPAPLRSRGRGRSTTGPTPIRVGACAPAPATTRREAKTDRLMAPPLPHARHARAPRPARVGVVASLAVVASLLLASTASVTAALSGQALFGVAEGRTAVVAVPVSSASSTPAVVPLPARAEALPAPAPTIEAAPAAVELCSTPAFAGALAAGDDAAAIAAAGGAEAFRAAVAGGTAPCVALDDPVRVWVVLNKTRPNAPIDYRPSALATPDGVRSIEGGSLRADAAAALSAMAGAVAAAGAGEIALQSGFRSYETQESTYANQVGAEGVEQADLTSARPGFSEHQSGLAGDVVACADGCGTLDDLAASAQGQWIVEHAWEYGWITRYEDGYAPITGYSPEPWHLRYIGPELARAYHDGGWHTLEEFFGLPAAPTYS